MALAFNLPFCTVMRILFTGGTGVLGTGTVTELLGRGHEIVLLSRHANDDARQWRHALLITAGAVAVRLIFAAWYSDGQRNTSPPI